MSLEEQVQQAFLARGLTLATAESCTGGLLAGRITGVAGSSAYFLGGVVSYSNDAKIALLGVEASALAAHGAVSEVVACQMARGARQRLGADLALSVTGVAGPGGGTPDKPVGLTWIGLADARGERAARFVWESDREGNRARSVEAALQLALAWAQGSQGP